MLGVTDSSKKKKLYISVYPFLNGAIVLDIYSSVEIQSHFDFAEKQ